MSTSFPKSLARVAIRAAVLVAVLTGAAPASEYAAAAPAGKAICDVIVKPGQSVAKAVERAKKGDTVCVRFGVYDEASNVLVGPAKANLTIVGFANRRLPVPPAIFTKSGCTIAVRARNVKVSNLALVGKAGRNTDGLCFLEGSAGSRATDVVTRMHAGVGFLVTHTRNIRLERVQAHDNGEPGIHGVVAQSVTIRSATLNRNGLDGGPFWRWSGIRFFAVKDSTVAKSTIKTSKGAGIYLNGVSNDNRIERNRILENGDDGINFESNVADKLGDDNPAVPARNRVFDNDLIGNEHEGIHIYSGAGNRFERNEVRGSHLSGIVLTCQAGAGNLVDKNTIAENGAGKKDDPIYDSGIVLRNSHPVRIEENAVLEHPDHGTLVQRITCARGAVTMAAGSVRHVIEGNHLAENEKNGVRVEGVDDVLVHQNVVEKNKGDGVAFLRGDMPRGARKGVIRDNEIRDNTGDGIFVAQDADETLIELSRIRRSGGSGIRIQNSKKVRVLKTTSVDNEKHGLEAIDADELRVADESTFLRNKQDGINATLSDTLAVDKVQASENLRDGTAIETGASHSVTETKVLRNKRHGIRIGSGASVTVRDNEVQGNTGDGIRLESGGNTVERNAVSGNRGHGIALGPSSSNTVTSNTFASNRRDGIHLHPGSSLNAFSRNRVEGNTTGIYIEAGATGNTILTNSFVSNDVGGSSANPTGTNTWFTRVGECRYGNYWTHGLTVEEHPRCPGIQTVTHYAGHEFTGEVLLTPPV